MANFILRIASLQTENAGKVLIRIFSFFDFTVTVNVRLSEIVRNFLVAVQVDVITYVLLIGLVVLQVLFSGELGHLCGRLAWSIVCLHFTVE